MHVHEAQINDEGIKTLFWYAHKPARLGADDSKEAQRYIPGISVPNFKGLTEPFSVPIQGDEEPVSLAIDWPRDFTDTHFIERVIFTGVIPAETILEGMVVKEPEIVNIGDSDRSNPTDDVFTNFCEIGGLLRVIAQKVQGKSPLEEPVLQGSATFALYDDMDEMQSFVRAFATGEISAADAFNITVSYPDLARRFGRFALPSIA